MSRSSKFNLIRCLIGAAATLVVIHQGTAALWPGLHHWAYSSVVSEPQQQIVDRSRKGDAIRSIRHATNGEQKPAASGSQPTPPSPPPATRPQIPVGCEAAVSPLALRTNVSARCLS